MHIESYFIIIIIFFSNLGWCPLGVGALHKLLTPRIAAVLHAVMLLGGLMVVFLRNNIIIHMS